MASSKLKTIILRFRDLSVSDTIQRHNDICESLGYVWWGWWSKPQEKIPFDEFALLERKAHEDDGFEWFLFDSGKNAYIKLSALIYVIKQQENEWSVQRRTKPPVTTQILSI